MNGVMKDIRIVAEIGSNWKDSTSQVKSYENFMLAPDCAGSAGATDVKIQVFRADTLYSRKRAPRLHRRSADYEVPLEWLPEFKQECIKHKVGFWASVFDVDLVDSVAKYADCLKVASGDITYQPLIEAVSYSCFKHGIPMCISTGAATMHEVSVAVNQISNFSAPNGLIVMNCVSNYPASMYEYDLSDYYVFVDDIVNDYYVPGEYDTPPSDCLLRIGLSDHTITYSCLLAQLAVAMNYTVFEKHFNPFYTKTPDGPVSLTSSQFENYTDAIWMAAILMEPKNDNRTRILDENHKERLWARRGSDGLRPVDSVSEDSGNESE